MGYEDVWTVLADLLTEVRKKGEAIPAGVMKDLHSAKTMIHILKADPTHIENIPRIETYLENVEFCLISTAQERFGTEYAEQWMKKLAEARKRVSERAEPGPRFIPGIPRDKRWVRVQVSEDTPQKDIELLAEESGLSFKMQDDGYLLVYGKTSNIKSFVKRMAEKFRSPRKAAKNPSNS